VDRQSQRTQSFRVKWIRTNFGNPRCAFICTCGRPVISLYLNFSTLACRRCHQAVYTSQRQNSQSRKRLAACKLRLELGGLPDISEPVVPKAKWKHRRTYQNTRNQLQKLEASIKSHRFKKPIDTKVFAYYLA
jgi:hypothetical protein